MKKSKLDDKDKIIASLHTEISMLKSIIYQMPGNVYWESLEGYLIGCNENMAKILHLPSPEAIKGKRVSDFIDEKLSKKVIKINQKVIETEKEKTYEEIGLDEKGRPATYLSRKTPYYDDKNEVTGVLGVSFDVTEQKKLTEKLRIAKRTAEESSRAKSKFLAMINHELRIPLTSILGFANFLEQPEITDKERETYVQYLIHSGNYLLSLVNQILEYTRAHSHVIVLKPVDFNFKNLLFFIKNMLDGVAKTKRIKIDIDYDPQAPLFIKTDPGILQQVLINLVGNALKFTKHGSVTIRVICLKQDKNETQLKIEIEDTGVGIPNDKLKSIFKEFYQVEDIYTRGASITGTGLGLAIVKNLVKLMKGKINVTSEVGKGSLFYFVATFPLGAEVDQMVAMDSADLKMNQSSQPLLPVLLIEDDPMVSFVHSKMLTDIGCLVDTAEQGMKALELFDEKYKIIFVDIGLPDMNGFEVISRLREKINPDHRVAIYALTGFSSEEERKQCLKAGADDVLVKPVSLSVFQEMIKTRIQA